MGLVGEASLSLVIERSLPENAFLNENRAVRSVVIVNRRALPRLPAKHQHLDKLVLHYPVARVIAGLESQIRLQFIGRNLRPFDKRVERRERRDGGLAAKSVGKIFKIEA